MAIAIRGTATTATGTTSITVAKPTGVVSGDVMYAAIVHAESEDNDWGSGTIPTGWTEIILEHQVGEVPPSIPGAGIWRKVAGGSEPADYTWTPSDTLSGMTGSIIAWSGVDNTTPEDATETTSISTASGNIDPAAITTVTTNAFVLALGFKDGSGTITSPPSGYTGVVGNIGTGTGGNGCYQAWAYVDAGATGSEDPGTFTNTSDQWGAVTLAIRPAPTGPTISDVETDEDIDDKQTAVTITGTTFEATQGTGKVEIGDNATYASGTKVTQTVTSWADTAIDITAVLGALTPGTPRYVWVTNDTGDRNGTGFIIAFHRAHAIRMIASANITDTGEATTAQMLAPAGKSTPGDFDAGRIVDIENPDNTTRNVTLDDFSEDEFCFEAKGAEASAGDIYEFRIVFAGEDVPTETVNPQMTISAGDESAPPQVLRRKNRRVYALE